MVSKRAAPARPAAHGRGDQVGEQPDAPVR
jgi:hypothetical protein